MLTSKSFQVIFNTSGQFNLVIGGTYGLSNEIKLKADRLISFSNMEFAHDLFRLMLLEQLYRGHCIKTNHHTTKMRNSKVHIYRGRTNLLLIIFLILLV